MRFQTGKHAGKTTEEISLKYPDWASWNVEKHPDAKHSKAFIELGKKFKEKPFTVLCDGNCGELAARATAYAGSPSLMFWCDHCSPMQSGGYWYKADRRAFDRRRTTPYPSYGGGKIEDFPGPSCAEAG